MKANLKSISRTALGRIFLGLAAGAACLAMGVSAQATDTKTTNADAHAGRAMHATQDITPVGDVAWDAEASADLKRALHDLHETWNTGDISSLKEFMIGDDVLVTFELDPRTHRPIALTSKAEIDAFISNIDASQVEDNLVTKLDHPELRCRATATWGVCTEQCKVYFSDKETGDVVATDHLISTQVAVKVDGDWRWIQWHMSQAGRAQSVAVRTPESDTPLVETPSN